MPSDKHETGQHAPPPPAPPKVDPAAAAAAKEAQAAGSIGAQVILDFNSDAGKGARGGLAATMDENIAGRDADMMAVGLDPNAPSGPPTGEPWVPPAVAAAAAPKHVAGSATRMSSLAAGIQEVPTPPPPARH
jgi:hypothetical protein